MERDTINKVVALYAKEQELLQVMSKIKGAKKATIHFTGKHESADVIFSDFATLLSEDATRYLKDQCIGFVMAELSNELKSIQNQLAVL